MPYIKQENRIKFDIALNKVWEVGTTGPGELNYLITEICNSYLLESSQSYQFYNDIIGALEGCKLEFYRRQVSKYEDLKIKENGDVY